VLPAPHENATGLDHIVSELDASPVHDGVSVTCLERLACLLAGTRRLLFRLSGQAVPGASLLLHDFVQRSPLHLVQFQGRSDAHFRTHIVQKVGHEHRVADILGILLGGKGHEHFLLSGGKCSGHAAYPYHQPAWRGRIGHDDTVVDQLA